MKKVKIDQSKVIKTNPIMVKESSGIKSSLFILILCALVIFLVTSCKPDNYKDPHQDTSATQYELSSTSEYSNRIYSTYTLEGCEYIVVGYGTNRWGSHKGNCKNPMHECK